MHKIMLFSQTGEENYKDLVKSILCLQTTKTMNAMKIFQFTIVKKNSEKSISFIDSPLFHVTYPVQTQG